MRFFKKMPSADGVSAGQTATFKLPIGSNYHGLHLEYSGVTLAQMKNIKVSCNGKPVWSFRDAAVLDTMNQFDGLAAANGVLDFWFDRRGLKTRAMEEDTAVNTGSPDPQTGKVITDFTVEIEIDGAATAPALTLYATLSEQRPGGPGTIRHITRFTRYMSGAGEFDVADLPVGGVTTQLLNRAWFFEASGQNINRLKVERDTYLIFDRTKALNEWIQVNGVRVPQANVVVYDRTEQGYGADPLDLRGVADYRYKLTTSAAGNVEIYHETIGALGD